MQWILAPLVKRSTKNRQYPKGWRVRKQRRLYRICFRTSDLNKHFWQNKSEYLLGSGTTLGEAEKQAYQTWLAKIVTTDKPYTMGSLFDRYQQQVIPKKSKSSIESNTISLTRLRLAIDLNQPVITFEPHQAFAYRDYVHTHLSAKRANLDIECLSHIFTKAIEWGCKVRHPIKSIVTKIPIASRDRYVTDEELDWFLSTANNFLKCYVPLKLATGKDQQMLLRVKLSDISEDGIFFPQRIKTQKGRGSILPFKYEGQSTGLKEIIDNIMSWRNRYLKVQSFYLFCSSYGKPMFNEKTGKAHNFKSQWQRAMTQAIALTPLDEKFTEHDLRAKTASDIEDAENAAQLLQHSSVSTTQKIYIRKPQIVLPFKR